jgi:hypothetical protein
VTSPDGQAGRLNVDVVGDTKGFGRDLQAKIDAEVRNVRARIKVEIDSTGLARDVRAAADRASRNAKIKVGVEVDSKGLTAGLRDAIRRAESNVRAIRVRVEVDSKGLTKSVREAAAKAEKGARVRVEVDANTARVTERIAALRAQRPEIDVEAHLDTSSLDRELEAARARARVQARDSRGRFTGNGGGGGPTPGTPGGGGGGGGGGLGGLLGKMPDVGKVMGLLKIPAMVAGVGMLIPLATQAAGALFAMGQAAAQAAGLIALIPAAGMGLGLVVGTLMAGLKGVGEASKALGKVSTDGGKQAAAQAAAQEAAAHRVQAAQRAVADSVRNADRTQIDGARAVTSARENLATTISSSAARVAAATAGLAASERNATTVAEALTRARKAAQEQLDDYVISLKGAALDEEGASLAVERAREALDKANRSATSTDLDRREADLAYRQAVQSLEEITERNGDMRDAAAEAAKAGVDGNADVIAAQDAVKQQVVDQKAAEKELHDARIAQTKDVAEAQFQLRRAYDDTKQANIDAAQSIADANYELASAQRSLRDAMTDSGAAASAAAAAMANLSPAGQRFVRFLDSTVKPALKSLKFAAQEALLPGLQAATGTLLKFQGPLARALTLTGNALGNVAKQGAAAIVSGPFTRDFGIVATENAKTLNAFGPALGSIIRGMGSLAAAGAPTITRIATAFGGLTTRFENYMQRMQTLGEQDPKKGLAGFFDRAYTAAAQLGRIMADVVAGFVNIGRASSASSKGLMDSLEGATQRFREFTNEPEAQARFKAFFDRSAETARELGRLLVDIAKTFGRMSENIDVNPVLRQIRTELLPALEKITTGAANAFGPQMVDLITNLAKVLGNLTEGGGGGIAGFVGTLNLFAKALVAITSIPGVGETLGVILKALGALAAVGFVAGRFAKMFGPVIKIVKEFMFLWPALKIMLIQGLRAIGTAVAANPLGAIIIGLVLLGAGLVLLWKKSETFRRIVKGAFEGVKAAAEAVFNFVKDHWPLLLGILTGPIGLAVVLVVKHFDAIKGFVLGVFSAIGNGIRAAWSWITGILRGAFGAIRSLFTAYFNAYRAIITTVFGAIRSAISTVWGAITGVFRNAISGITTIFRGLWNGLASITNTIFGGIRNTISTILGGIRGAFSSAVSFIRTAWDGIREAVAAPIRFVVNTVYNNGIRRAWNSLAGLVNLPGLPEYRLAGGGKIPGYAPGKDKVPTLLSPGEGVLTPQATSMVGGASGIRAINDAAGRRASQKPGGEGATAFAGGGVFGDLKSIGSGIVGGVKSGIGKVGDVASAGLKWTVNHILSTALYPVRGWLNDLGNTTIAKVLRATVEKAITGVVAKVKDVVPGLARGATILPRKGGTLTRVAEAGRAEAVVDEGVLNKRLTDMESLADLLKHLGTSVTIEDGAIRLTVVNPVGETTEQTLNSRLRVMGAMGLFEAGQPSDA